MCNEMAFYRSISFFYLCARACVCISRSTSNKRFTIVHTHTHARTHIKQHCKNDKIIALKLLYVVWWSSYHWKWLLFYMFIWELHGFSALTTPNTQHRAATTYIVLILIRARMRTISTKFQKHSWLQCCWCFEWWWRSHMNQSDYVLQLPI